MTKKEKAVIDKIIDKIITSEVLVKGTDYKFSSAVRTRKLIGVEENEPDTEIVTEIRIDNLFSEESKIQGVRIIMQTNHFTVEVCEKVDAYWKLLQIGNVAIDFEEISEIYTDYYNHH